MNEKTLGGILAKPVKEWKTGCGSQANICFSDKRLSAVWNGVSLSYLASLILILNGIMASFYRVYEERCLLLQMFIKNLKTAGFLRAKSS